MGFFSFFGESHNKPDIKSVPSDLEQLKKRRDDLIGMAGNPDFHQGGDQAEINRLNAQINALEGKSPTEPTSPAKPTFIVPGIDGVLEADKPDPQVPAPEIPKAA